MSMRKKYGIGLAVALMAALAAATGRGESETLGGVTWSYDIESNGTATVTWANPAVGVVTIPASLGGHPVRRIGDGAFGGRGGMTGVAIPDGVTEIGWNAFNGCSGLTSVVVPDSVTSFGHYAFGECTGLVSATLGKGAKDFGEVVFRGCESLERIEVDADNPNYESEDGVLFTKGKKKLFCCPGGKVGSYAIPEGVEDVGEYAFEYCGKLSEVTIPGSVRHLDDFAFSGCGGVTGMDIPGGVRQIGIYAFYNCGALERVTIPGSVSEIGYGVFDGCGKLGEIHVAAGNAKYETGDGVLFSRGKRQLLRFPPGKAGAYAIPESVTEIGAQAFSGCGRVTRLSIPGSVTKIEGYAFRQCGGLEEVLLKNGMESIGTYAFSHCGNLKKVSIPASVTEIAFRAFYNCTAIEAFEVEDGNAGYGSDEGVLFSAGKRELMYYTTGKTGAYIIPDGVEFIGWDAFYGSRGLTAVTIPGSVRRIGYEAFRGCTGLVEAVIPEGVEAIDEFAFYGCAGLTRVEIPASVKRIDFYAFTDCVSLTGIEVADDSGHFENEGGVLFTKGKECLVCCPAGKMGAYAIPAGVKRLNVCAFAGCAGLTEVAIPEGLEEIGGGAFSRCAGLTALRLPESVTHVDNQVFQGCSGLATLFVPASWKGTTMLKPAGVPEGCEIVYYETATETTPVPVPYRWLEEMAGTILAEHDGDYEAAAMATSENGRPVWECWVAGLEPEDVESELRVRGTWTGTNFEVSVEGGEKEGRVYITEGAAALSENTVWGEPDDATRFFRVRVEVNTEGGEGGN